MAAKPAVRRSMAYPEPLDEEELQRLYQWVDEVPLSRPKRNMARDFSDGVLCAELVKHYFPRLVELHNYSSQHAVSRKKYNWETLNAKVFRKMGFSLSPAQVNALALSEHGAIENMLMDLQEKMIAYKDRIEAAPQNNGIPDSPHYAKPVAPARAPAVSDSHTGAGRAPVNQGRSHHHAAGRRQPPVPKHGPAAAIASGKHAAAQQHHHHLHPGAGSGAGAADAYQDAAAVLEKEEQILEMQETIDILAAKIDKLEQLVRVKDSRIKVLAARLSKHGLPTS